jgi:hypothetical protein
VRRLHTPLHPDLRADFILTNPPFGLCSRAPRGDRPAGRTPRASRLRLRRQSAAGGAALMKEMEV